MKITYFKIENYRNITYAECDNLPNLMVICGGNGCGKSTILNALMTAKENAAPYGGFQMDPRSVSSNAELATVTLRLSFSEVEKEWYLNKYHQECPDIDEIIIEIQKGGRARAVKRSQFVKMLLSWYSKEYQQSPGFFDYIDAHRIVQKKQLSTWNSSLLSDQQSKQSLGAIGTQKFNLIKEYLASLVMKDAQEILAAKRNGKDSNPDSLKEIRIFFNDFFHPMKFKDVQIDCSPFKYIIETPKGEIDIDDLSSGEKEILNTYIHFHQLKPNDAVILFDEIDAHLHPDIERRYLKLFKDMSTNNQIIITTHSPEIMVSSGSESLFSLSKVQDPVNLNQLSRVTANDDLHFALSEVMGTNGLVSINRKIVFIEGTESSSDRYIYESFFPPSEFNVSFIPAGNSSTNRSIASKVNLLLSSTGTFQEFYSIIDGDIERFEDDDSIDHRLFRLPVYHIENYLIDPDVIFEITKKLMLDKCPYQSNDDVKLKLIELLSEEKHLNAYTKAIFDSEVAKKAKKAWDSVYKRDSSGLEDIIFPKFEEIKEISKGRLEDSIISGEWRKKCKGRDLIKSFCSIHNFKYEFFRNLIISEMNKVPEELNVIMNSIVN